MQDVKFGDGCTASRRPTSADRRADTHHVLTRRASDASHFLDPTCRQPSSPTISTSDRFRYFTDFDHASTNSSHLNTQISDNMDHPQTPRILAPHLSNFQHRIVRVLGKVVQLRGEQAIIDAGGQIDVILNRVSNDPVASDEFFFLASLQHLNRKEI